MTDEEFKRLADKVEENTNAINKLIDLMTENNVGLKEALRDISRKQDKDSRGHFWREVGANLTGDVITLLFLEEIFKKKG